MKVKATNGKFSTYFFFYYRLMGKRLFVSLFLSVLVTVLDGVSLLLFLPLIQSSDGTKGTSAAAGSGFVNTFLAVIQKNGAALSVTGILMLITVLFAVKGGVRFLQLTYQVTVKHSLIKQIRLALYNKLNDIPYKEFFSAKASYIQNTFTVEMQYLIQTINPFLGFIQSSVILLTYFSLSLFINSSFAIAAAVCLSVYHLFYKSVSKPVYNTSKTVTDKNKDFTNLLVQALRYFKYLKSTGRFHVFGKQIRQVITDTEAVNKKIGMRTSFSLSVKEPLIVLCIMAMIFFQLHYLHETLDVIFVNLLLLFRMLSTAASAQNNLQSFYEHASSIDAVSGLLSAGTPLQHNESKPVFSGLKHDIVLKDIRLSFYGKPLLNGIHLTIPAKRTIAIVGRIGSGKTTLFNLISGLIPPDEGSILFDEVPIAALDIHSLQGKIGSISQEAVIFNDTLFNNITFWGEHSPGNTKKVWEILELLSFTDFVFALPAKENTVIGEYGIQLSGGQKQLVNIARELFKNPDILLFDEATSALDAETAQVVQKSLNRLHGRYTILLIAHSAASIKGADIIYVLREGKVSESGSYGALLTRSDHFKCLFDLQSAG